MAKVYTSQDPSHVLQDRVSEDWTRAVKDSPTILSLLGETPYVAGAGGSHTWRNAYDAPLMINQISYTPLTATTGTLTIPPAQTMLFKEGDDLRLENDSVTLRIEAVTAGSLSVRLLGWHGSLLDPTDPVNPGTGIPTGSDVLWLVQARAIKEVNYLFDGRGGFKEDDFDWNGIQILRQHRIHTETLQDTATLDNASQIMDMQLDDMIKKNIRDINEIIIGSGERAKSRDEADVTGRCGGITWLANVDTTVTPAAGCVKYRKDTPGPLTYNDVKNLLRMLAEWGDASMGQWALICSVDIQGQISSWMRGTELVAPIQNITGIQDTIYGKFINQIINPFASGVIPVIVEPNMPNNQVYLINTNNTKIVYRERPAVKIINPDNAMDFDGAIIRIRTKMSLQFQNSFCNVGVIRGITP